MQPFAFRVKVRIEKGVVRSSDWDTVARRMPDPETLTFTLPIRIHKPLRLIQRRHVPVKLAKVIKVSAPVVSR
ncbi:hypothetical protein M422DRAFT_277267 [Sphaerobolus stellatus SS14]|uniref:Uncharacterized protein n=1 Tax=Sphaerobolus stellatus (strain SS14) TaxID=990650 RepID=A0A0C9U9X3_SPHS4|nr:hypothetical protein M422DRAFT_277267 [Sphaerobolus stellatus SS14]